MNICKHNLSQIVLISLELADEQKRILVTEICPFET